LTYDSWTLRRRDVTCPDLQKKTVEERRRPEIPSAKTPESFANGLRNWPIIRSGAIEPG
jgi:hypothetical protein